MREVSAADELRRPGFSETFYGYLHHWFGPCDAAELRHLLLLISGRIWEQTVPKPLRVPEWMCSNASVQREIDLNGDTLHSSAFGVSLYRRPSIKYTRRVMFQIGLAMRSVATHPRAKKFTCRPEVTVTEMYSGDPRLGSRLSGYLCTFHQDSIDKLPDAVLEHLRADID